MPLFIVATPIGNYKDITLRALEVLRSADLVIGEERKELSKLFKFLEIPPKDTEFLNEHSRPEDIRSLLEICRTKNVALVSDCGTPGFCDPGALLVAACRKEKIPVTPLPGASSLMTLLSVAGHRLDQFLFLGFLPAEREERNRSLQSLKTQKTPVVLMDTPYRLAKLISELALIFPARKAILGLNLTQPEEKILEDSIQNLSKYAEGKKAEFVLILL